MTNSPSARDTVKNNYSSLPNEKEDKKLKRLISRKLVQKYGSLQNEKHMKPLKKYIFLKMTLIRGYVLAKEIM